MVSNLLPDLPVIFNNWIIHILLTEKDIKFGSFALLIEWSLWHIVSCIAAKFVLFIRLRHIPKSVFNICSNFSVNFCLVYVDKEFSCGSSLYMFFPCAGDLGLLVVCKDPLGRFWEVSNWILRIKKIFFDKKYIGQCFFSSLPHI